MKNLKNLLVFVILFCLMATTLVACKGTSAVPPATTEKTTTKIVTVVKRDTVLYTQKDSSFYKAYLACIDGKIIYRQPPIFKTSKSKYLQPPKVQIKDNILTIDCRVEAQKLFVTWKENYIKQTISTTKKTPYPVPADLSNWQQIQILLGRLLLVLVVLLGAGLLYKNRN